MKIQTQNGSGRRLFELDRQGAPSNSVPKVNLNILQSKLPTDFRDRSRRKQTRDHSIPSFEYDFFSAKQSQKPENGQEIAEKGHPALSLCAFPDFRAEIKKLRFEVNAKTILNFPCKASEDKQRYKPAFMTQHVSWLERLFEKENKIIERVRVRRSEEWLPSHSVEDLALLFYLFFVVDEDQEYAEMFAPSFFKTLKQILVHRPRLAKKAIDWADFFVVGLAEKLALLSISAAKLSRALFRLFQMLESSRDLEIARLTEQLSRPLLVMCGLFSDLWPDLATSPDFAKVLTLFARSNRPVETALYIFQFIKHMHVPNAPKCHLPLTRRLVSFLFSNLPKVYFPQITLLFTGFVEKSSCLDCVFEFHLQLLQQTLGYQHFMNVNFEKPPLMPEPFPEFRSFANAVKPSNSLFAASLLEVQELIEMDTKQPEEAVVQAGSSFFKNKLLKQRQSKVVRSFRKNGLLSDLFQILIGSNHFQNSSLTHHQNDLGNGYNSPKSNIRHIIREMYGFGANSQNPEDQNIENELSCPSEVILMFSITACVKGLIPVSYCLPFIWKHFQKFYKPSEVARKGDVQRPLNTQQANERKPTLNIDAINELYTFGGEQGMLLDNEKIVEQEIADLARRIVEKMKNKHKEGFIVFRCIL